nr:hypothetical protein [Pseudodesulfovibrio sp.]
MRDELKGMSEKDYWCYGVDESSLDHCFSMVIKIIENQNSVLEMEIKKIKMREELPSVIDEIISDVAHYTWCDAQVLWQLALWRCQGIFEAMIKYSFLKKPNHYFNGLVSKLDDLRKEGFILSDEEFETIKAWGNLRNAISHAPPEEYRPAQIMESDLVEYIELVKGLCARWRNQIVKA